MNRHRAVLRPRWGRIAASAASAAVLVTAVVGAMGYSDHHAAEAQVPPRAATSASSAAATPTTTPAEPSSSAPAYSPSPSPSRSASSSTPAITTALPDGSGTGRRAVYDITDQRVWIVDADDHVERTYPVSGSVEHNLRPGTYSVYSRSRWAVGIDDSGVMQYFVRFAHGSDEGAAIGFHSIPTKHGKPLQTLAQLGHPESHGCVRQATPDAIAMWDFAQIGTKVVVLA